jgi:hypothetical protein
LNLLEEVLAEHQDTTSSGEDGGVLTNDISSSLLKRVLSDRKPDECHNVQEKSSQK